MSKTPEDFPGREEAKELGAKKPDFGIFEKMQKDLDELAQKYSSEVKAESEKINEAEVNVEKILDSRGRKAAESLAAERAAEIKDTAADKAYAVKEAAAEKVETVKEEAADKVGAVKEAAADKADAVKEAAADKAADVKNAAEDKIDDMKDAMTEKLTDMKEAAADKVDAVKDAAADKLPGMGSDHKIDVRAALGAATGAAAAGEAAKAGKEIKAGADADAVPKADAAADLKDISAGKPATGGDMPSSPRDVLENKILKTKRTKGWQVLLIEIVVIIIAVVVTFTVILGSSTVKGTSMEPNFFEGDRVLYFRMASDFEQNDVIIFHTEENRDLIKRVIAVEGDVVDINDGEVLVNGTPVESINVSQETEESVSGVSDPVDFPLTVEKDHVFVLGDNRSVSIDSRTKKIGQISKSDIAGRVFYMMRGKTK